MSRWEARREVQGEIARFAIETHSARRPESLLRQLERPDRETSNVGLGTLPLGGVPAATKRPWMLFWQRRKAPLKA